MAARDERVNQAELKRLTESLRRDNWEIAALEMILKRARARAIKNYKRISDLTASDNAKRSAVV